MSGESMGQARIRRDQDRQATQHHLTSDKIAQSYMPQIRDAARPPRTANSPD